MLTLRELTPNRANKMYTKILSDMLAARELKQVIGLTDSKRAFKV